MKAYLASSNDCETHEIVFAKTASKARSIAYGTDGLQDIEFVNINVRRVKEFDKCYTGKSSYLHYSVEVQRIARGLGYWFSEQWDSCSECGLYVYDDLEESHLTETEYGEICRECQLDN